MTYAGMVDALVREDSAYVVKSDINDGWPCLSSEVRVKEVTQLRGSGIEGDEYLISTAEELKFARDKINAETGNNLYSSAWYKLTNDIDLGGGEWTPIGVDFDNYFCGTFDGDGHAVKNFVITTAGEANVGFFACATSSKIMNLGIESSTIQVRSNLRGFMVANGDGTFKNCYVKDCTFARCQNEEFGACGGFIGQVRQTSTFENCYVYGCTFLGNARTSVGGFVGQFQQKGDYKFYNCYTAKAVFNKYDTNNYASVYPFINNIAQYQNTDCKVSIENCFSDAAGSNGANNNANWNFVEYKEAASPEKAKVEGKDLSAITSALVKGDSAFKTDQSINDGYPALSFEKAKTNDVLPYVISAVKPGANVKVTLKENTAETGAKLYVASYDNNGRVAAAEEKVAKDGEITTGISSIGVAKVKAFVGDSDINPISDQFWGVQVNDGQFTEVIKVNADDSGSGSGDLVIPTRKTRVVTIGDSIMDSVNNGLSNGESWEKRGWEQYFPNYFDSDKTAFVKHGHSGWTIQYFMDSTCGVNSYHSCRWDTIKEQFGSGDYVILSLGTNDEGRMNGGVQKDKWEEYTSERFMTWYKQVITEARAKGATVILTTPIPGSGNTKKDGDVTYFDDTYVCPTARAAIKAVGTECDVTVIDLSELFTAELNKMIDGTDGYTKTSYAEMIATSTGPGVIYSDGVHMTETGAELIAKIVARELKANDVATEILK